MKEYIANLLKKKKKISTEDYVGIKRDFDKSISELTHVEDETRASKTEMEYKLRNCVKDCNDVGFNQYSKIHRIYDTREKQISNAKIALDVMAISFKEAYQAQKLKQTMDRVKDLTSGIPGASEVYETLDEMQAVILETANGDVYKTEQNVSLQPWQKELKAKIEAEIRIDTEAAQGLEEKIKKEKKEIEAGA